MEIAYAWDMPSKHTFKIRCIRNWIAREITLGEWADPFCGESRIAQRRGDLLHGTDAHDFFGGIADASLDGVLFDPPYSMEQVKRVYKRVGIEYWQKIGNNKNGGFPQVKDEVARCVKVGGKVLSFGWSSSGMGKNRGFKKTAMLVVGHGGTHHDTICVAEIKFK